ncbi:MAG: biotin/lipoyl-binding protein [Anaerolineales bacterium]|nr:biotin/lipoyl-binding protein [Anaerolineales bacterium]MCA9928736.1 biotin/lipoyl-binding protein [Anaerolineales bacterium]
MSKLTVKIDEHTFHIEMERFSLNGDAFTAVIDGKPVTVMVPNPTQRHDRMDWIVVDGRPYELVFDPDMRWLKAYCGIHRIDVQDTEAIAPRPRSGDGRVKALIPGLITRILVEPGEHVDIGRPVIVLEAMKMENEIRAPCTGTIEALHVKPGQSVTRGEVLAEIKDCR